MESPFEIMEQSGSLARLPANRPLDLRREGLNGYEEVHGAPLIPL